MGFSLSDIPIVGPTLSKIYGSTQVPKQPGVGGPVDVTKQPTGNVPITVQDPTTGYYYDPATGTTYQDKEGKVPVTNPNVAQQVAANYARSTSLGTDARSLNPQLDATTAAQTELATNLGRTINDPNAPSVAGTQLGRAMDSNTRTILGTAAGVGGANAYDARRAAVNALSTANLGAAGDAAMLRAKEVSDAQSNRGNVLNQQFQGTQQRQATNLQGSQAASQTAMTGQTAQQGLNEKAEDKNSDTNTKLIGAAAKAISAFA